MFRTSRAVVALLGVAGIGLAEAQPLGSAFTYQGQLTESGQLANGLYDLQFCLFDSPSNPVAIVCASDFDDVPVEAGVFVIVLDFGAAPFVGQQRFIELRVRPGAGTSGYTILAPRQLVRAVPEALRSSVAGAASMAPWSGLSGVPVGFADGIDDDSGGTITSIRAGIGLSGGTITSSGTIGIDNGGVGPAQLASGAVGLAQINTAQVQARVTGTCTLGSYLRGISVDGSPICADLPGVNTLTTVNNPAGGGGTSAAIAVGADGLPVISYRSNTGGALMVAKCANAACTGAAAVTTVDPLNDVDGFTTDIAIGADGLPVVSYGNTSIRIAKCTNPACSGAATITQLASLGIIGGQNRPIAVGTDGRPVISYFDGDSLRVAKCANAACTGTATITPVDNPVGSSAQISIAVGADNRPVISYRNAANGTLRVAKCANAACTGTATVTTIDGFPGNLVAQSNSIAVGSDGLPVIGYSGDSAGSLKVAQCSTAACTGVATITTVDDPLANNVGRDISIAIGADSLPVLSYRDNTANTLKVAKCANAACAGVATITTVDDPTNPVTGDTSIAIGTDGLAVISYGDGTGAFKVAKCGTRSCR